MPIITKPLLAAKNPDLDKLIFPLFCTPKIDGIRCLVIDGKAVSRSFKPIPNHHIRNMIELHCPDGFDGEIICGDGFNDVQSMVMSQNGTPSFTYMVFDYVKDTLVKPYIARCTDLTNYFKQQHQIHTFCQAIVPEVAVDLEDLHRIMDKHLAEGFEGTMTRIASAPYKCGRASLKEGYLTAFKSFTDAEGEVIGFEEQMQNNNEKEKDAFGNSERSSHQVNLTPKNTLGAFIVKTPEGSIFKIGTGKGLTQELRKEIWDNKDKYLGKLVHYRFQSHGVKNLPRIPSFYGFRSVEDL